MSGRARLRARPVRKYAGTGFGQKYRMHPFAAAIARKQLQSLDERNAALKASIRRLNDRLVKLPGLAEPRCRPDQDRVYYNGNMLILDQKKAGFTREGVLRAQRYNARLGRRSDFVMWSLLRKEL